MYLKLKLGIVYKDGKIINHRSLIKVLLNPPLRYFGYQIETDFCYINNKLKNSHLRKCERTRKIKYEIYPDNCFDFILKKRIII